MMVRVLVLLIVGVVLTGCIGGDDSPAGAQMIAEVTADPIRGSCRDRWINIFPAGGEQVTAAAENGAELEPGTCRYSFDAQVEEATSYRFEARNWPDITLTSDDIERAEANGDIVLLVHLDFRR